MFKNKKVIIYGLLVLNMFILSIFLIVLHLYEYLILSGVLCAVLVFLLVRELNNNSQTDESKYEGQVNRLIKTYSPILVNTNTFPNLSGKSVMPVAQFDDIVNAQAEVRKPVYYVKGKDSTAFYLLNDEMFLIYYVKVNENEKSELEMEIDKMESSDVVTVDQPVEVPTEEVKEETPVEEVKEEVPVEEPASAPAEEAVEEPVATPVEEVKEEVPVEEPIEEVHDVEEDLKLEAPITDEVLEAHEEVVSQLETPATAEEPEVEAPLPEMGNPTVETPEEEPQIVTNV